MDREKIIKDLEECMTASCRGYKPGLYCPYNDEEWDIMRDALTLLKEQEAERLEFIESIAKLTAENELLKKPEIVRCRYCKHEKTCCRRRTDNPDWFCADGKRRDDRPKGDKE